MDNRLEKLEKELAELKKERDADRYIEIADSPEELARKEHLMELAKKFWQSPAGKKAIHNAVIGDRKDTKQE